MSLGVCLCSYACVLCSLGVCLCLCMSVFFCVVRSVSVPVASHSEFPFALSLALFYVSNSKCNAQC